jgi:hypothetical protein
MGKAGPGYYTMKGVTRMVKRREEPPVLPTRIHAVIRQDFRTQIIPYPLPDPCIIGQYIPDQIIKRSVTFMKQNKGFLVYKGYSSSPGGVL